MKQTKLEERIEEILYSDNGIPETWAGSEESIPKDKRIGKLLSLMETDRKEAVKEFVKFLISKGMYMEGLYEQYLTSQLEAVTTDTYQSNPEELSKSTPTKGDK